MSTAVDRAIREPSIASVSEYARRVSLLAWTYVGLTAGAIVGIGMLVWQAQLYVTLSQRSNVETLTLAFFLLFFAYLGALSLRGALGAARIGYYAVLRTLGTPGMEVERRKMRALGPPHSNADRTVALNFALEIESAPCRPFSLRVEDEAGSMGVIEVEGVRVTHRPAVKTGSDTLLAFFTEQVDGLLARRGAPAGLDVIQWQSIDDEAASQYLNLVQFARNLERGLHTGELWPKRIITDDERDEVERRLSSLCPALRSECFLPRWEYQAEHKVPLIPEPLGLLSLSRTERRVDPLASMGCALAIVVAVVIVLILIFVFPPWVPGV